MGVDAVLIDVNADDAVGVMIFLIFFFFFFYVSIIDEEQGGGEREPFSLQDINFKVHIGELVAVIGPVGSGKTSLLNAIMGEMERMKGKVKLQCTVGYVSQVLLYLIIFLLFSFVIFLFFSHFSFFSFYCFLIVNIPIYVASMDQKCHNSRQHSIWSSLQPYQI